MKTIIIAAALLAASLAPAFAQSAAAKGCAAKLNADAKTIFDQAAPEIAKGGKVKDAVTSTTRSLAMSGKIARGDARPNAEAAGACLNM